MRLPPTGNRQHIFYVDGLLFLTIIGVRALMMMPRTENPEVSVPGSSIIVLMPGASPIDMEKMVILPVEEALNELDGIVRIVSDAREGLAVVAVEFEFNEDPQEKFDEVTQQINGMRGTLPDEILQLDMWKWSIADMAMMQLALISETAPYNEMEKVADDFSNRVLKIQNIRKITLYGLPGQEIHVNLDFEKMALVNTSIEQISRAIESNNVNIPGGAIKLGPTSLSVKSSGSFQNLDEIRNCVVNSYQGRLIYLRDVAEVEFEYEVQKTLTRYGDKLMTHEGGGASRSIFLGLARRRV